MAALYIDVNNMYNSIKITYGKKLNYEKLLNWCQDIETIDIRRAYMPYMDKNLFDRFVANVSRFYDIIETQKDERHICERMFLDLVLETENSKTIIVVSSSPNVRYYQEMYPDNRIIQLGAGLRERTLKNIEIPPSVLE